MFDELNNIKEKAQKEIELCKQEIELDQIRIKYLGRKGIITNLIKDISNIDPCDRPEFGKVG